MFSPLAAARSPLPAHIIWRLSGSPGTDSLAYINFYKNKNHFTLLSGTSLSIRN